MPSGEHLSKSHQTRVGSRPRPGRIGVGGMRQAAIEEQRKPGETLDEATLRLQVARADTEELDRQKRQLELDKLRGAVVSKEDAVDLAQQAVLRVVAILDMIPEQLRDRLDPSHHFVCEILDALLRDARTKVASAEQ